MFWFPPLLIQGYYGPREWQIPLALLVAESVDHSGYRGCRGNHGVPVQERNPTILTRVLELLPHGWSQKQCKTCGIVFAFPPLDEPSDINAKDILAEELDRHVTQSHIDLPSAREGDRVIDLARE
jgi:hypothetical protein